MDRVRLSCERDVTYVTYHAIITKSWWNYGGSADARTREESCKKFYYSFCYRSLANWFLHVGAKTGIHIFTMSLFQVISICLPVKNELQWPVFQEYIIYLHEFFFFYFQLTTQVFLREILLPNLFNAKINIS